MKNSEQEYVKEITSLPSKELVAQEICEMAVDPESNIFQAMRSFEKIFKSINIKCSPKGIQYFLQLAKRFGTVSAINGALQKRVNEIDVAAENLFDAMDRQGVTPDLIASKMVELVDSSQDSIKLSALRMCVPVMIEKDRAEKFKKKATMKNVNAEPEDEDIISLEEKRTDNLDSVIKKIQDTKISELSVGG